MGAGRLYTTIRKPSHLYHDHELPAARPLLKFQLACAAAHAVWALTQLHPDVYAHLLATAHQMQCHGMPHSTETLHLYQLLADANPLFHVLPMQFGRCHCSNQTSAPIYHLISTRRLHPSTSCCSPSAAASTGLLALQSWLELPCCRETGEGRCDCCLCAMGSLADGCIFGRPSVEATAVHACLCFACLAMFS